MTDNYCSTGSTWFAPPVPVSVYRKGRKCGELTRDNNEFTTAWTNNWRVAWFRGSELDRAECDRQCAIRNANPG